MAGTTTKAKPMTKSDMLKEIATRSGLERKQVAAVVDGIIELASEAIGKGGPGVFKLAGLVQLKRVDKPAQPARRGIDPFTKAERDFPAKPAKSVVKASALKAAKDAVA